METAPKTKELAIEAFDRWINQRPGLDPANYIDPYRSDPDRVRAYRSEQRSIIKDKHRALYALRLFRICDYDPERMIRAFTAFSGRLEWSDEGLEYCTGQYWPTEYRIAAAIVLEYYVTLTERTEADQATA